MAQKLTKKSKVAVKPIKTTPVRKGAQVMPKERISAVGRRKTAIARIRIWPGKQEITVNGQPLSSYFKTDIQKRIALAPLYVAELFSSFTGSIKVQGGGIVSQAEAVSHGLARAIVKIDQEKYKSLMRGKGFLTRDPRMKETRKSGQGGRARAKKQSPKR